MVYTQKGVIRFWFWFFEIGFIKLVGYHQTHSLILNLRCGISHL